MTESLVPPAGMVMVYMPDRGVGDLMWHLPTLRAIASRAIEGRVLLAARPSSRAKELLAAEPCVELIDYVEYRAGTFRHLVEIVDFFRLCRLRRPRAVWILEKIDRPAIGAALAGVRERRGFGLGHSQEGWLTHGPFLPRTLRPAHRIAKLAAFEDLHGLKVASREPALAPVPAALDLIQDRFGDRPKPWIVYGVGASEPRRCWPLDRFTALSGALSDLGGTHFWLGGPSDSPAVDAELARAERSCINVNACDLKLDAGAALLSRADLFIGNDSGPLNLAASVGLTAIGLFGDSPPLDYSRFLRPLIGPPGGMSALSVESVAGIARLSL
ncbi:glycosyltransferase family 9 protein [Caulobacter henricii]|uniref:Heptosyltransferase n=1 Tax=Caulobacter henricii TaxID=69395 RepID=A0A0P0P275_9CAUL|nr:glycosyltransferase family 9 protein [Caulobacter henricii]ALL14627.1 heptosyltransferase [Caulobacter henricii]